MTHTTARRLALLAAVLLAAAGTTAWVAGHGRADAATQSTAATRVINFLKSISGTSIVSGQHNKEPATAPGYYTDLAHGVTGQWPGLWGGELMFRAADVANRQLVINQAKTEWNNGSLVALTWHVCPPTQGSSCEFEGGVKSSITDAQFNQIITDGTALNTAWKNRLNEVVPYLQQLEDAGVPVLFRPLHEMNEAWNWWGHRPGASGSARLYQITHDYLANTKGLSNLIWVWNVQDNPAGGWSSYYPGDAYVDVVTLDAWYKSLPSSSDYSQIQAIAAPGGKPIALAETGKMPTSAMLTSQTKWTYFMVWSEYLKGNNTNAEIQACYFHPRVLNQDEFTV